MLNISVKLFLCVHLIKSILCHQYDVKGWDTAAEWLKQSIDETVDPCEDFFQFACGKFNETHPHSNVTKETDVAQENLVGTLTEALNKINLESSKTEEFKRSTKIFYDQCKQRQSFDDGAMLKLFQELYENLIEYLLPHLKENPGNIANNTNYPWENGTSSFQFWHFVGMLQRVLGTPFLIQAEVLPANFADGCTNVPTVYLRPVVVESSWNAEGVVDDLLPFLLKYHNHTVEEREINETKLEIGSFCSNLAKLLENSSVMWSNELIDYRNIRQIRFNDLAKEISSVNWDGYFHGLFPENIRQTFLKSNPYIQLEFEDYHREINSVVEKFGYVTATNVGFLIALKNYAEFVSYGLIKIEDRRGAGIWKFSNDHCLDTVVRYFSAASLRLLVDEYKIDVEKWKNDLSLIKNLIFSSFRYQIYSTDYLSPEEKMLFINKANNIQFYGDIPSWITDDNQVNKKTPKYDAKYSLVANELLAQKELFMQQMQPLVSGKMDDAPPILKRNAWNDVRELGNIRFLLGYQLPPLYSYSYPLVAKFSIVGMIMGHECMHSFATFLYKNTSELPFDGFYVATRLALRNSTFDILRAKVDCLIPYYNQYCQTEPNLFDGGQPSESCKYGYDTQEENAADAEAIKIAYNAYKFATQTFGDEPVLNQYPEFTNDQLFFLFYARRLCTKGAKNDFRKGTQHSADKARVEQPLMNFPSFAKAFNCKRGQKYGREDRCNMYGGYIK